MKYCIGFSEEASPKKAVADVLNQIDSDKISFLLYFSDVERFQDLTKEISLFLPEVQTMGASSYIVISSKGISKKALGVLALYDDTQISLGILPDVTVFPLQYIQNVQDALAKLPLDKKNICFEITAAFNNGEEKTLDTFHKVLGDDIKIFGGTAGNSLKDTTTYVAQNGDVYTNACVFAFLNTETDVFINREDIFKPTSKVFTVTESNPNKRTIYTLDNLPAAESLSNALSIPKVSLRDYLTSHPLGHIINDKQYIIEPLSINEDDSITFFAQVFKHSKVALFEENNIDSVFENTKKIVKQAVPTPNFSLVVNCLARSTHFEEINCMDSLYNSLNEYAGDYLGFSGFGEQYSTYHFNQSMLTATFFERLEKSQTTFLDEDIDEFSGLLNEKGFIKECKTVLDENLEINFVLCVFKINNFRVINDSFGFEKGDEVLKFMSQLLKKDIKQNEVCGHLHSTAFAFLVPYTIDVMDKLSKIKYIDCSEIDLPYQLTVKAGLCNINDVCQGEILYSDIRLAIDYAMIAQSKVLNTSVTSFYFYNHDMHQKLLTEAEITSKMRNGLKNHEFQLYFQPQYNHSTGSLVGAEALCRWVNTDGSIISPTVFIPIFEKNGFIQELDKYIWDRTFSTVADWVKRNLDPVPVSTNISRISLRNPGLPQHFARLCVQYDVDPKLIHLEFTESSYMDNQEQIITTAKNFQKEGFKIAMDDFGSGYSSLNTLKDLPIDILKFDMEFVKGSSSSRGGIILASLMRMAQALNLQTITEGV